MYIQTEFENLFEPRESKRDLTIVHDFLKKKLDWICDDEKTDIKIRECIKSFCDLLAGRHCDADAVELRFCSMGKEIWHWPDQCLKDSVQILYIDKRKHFFYIKHEAVETIELGCFSDGTDEFGSKCFEVAFEFFNDDWFVSKDWYEDNGYVLNNAVKVKADDVRKKLSHIELKGDIVCKMIKDEREQYFPDKIDEKTSVGLKIAAEMKACSLDGADKHDHGSSRISLFVRIKEFLGIKL